MIETSEQRAIGMMLQKHIVDPLVNGRFSMNNTLLIKMVLVLCHMEKNIAETCRLCNNCDPKTLKRWTEDPKLNFPSYHKDPGGKHYYYLDEIEQWKEEHPEILQRVDQKRKK